MELLTIDLEEAYEHYYLLFKDKIIWLDVRDNEDYENGHIKGAINIELDDLLDNLSSLPKDKSIVIYCEDIDCGSSKAAGRMLLKNGFKQDKIRVLKAGFLGWKRSGLPIE